MLSVPFARTSALVLLAAAMMAPAAARATPYAKFDHLSVSSPQGVQPVTLHVANDGSRWTHVVAEKVRLPVQVDIKVKTGSVTYFALFNGGSPAPESERIFESFAFDNTKHFDKSVLTDEIRADRLGNGINSIVSACNARLAQGADIMKAQPPFTQLVSIGIKARADKNVFNAKSRWKDANGVLIVTVVCDAPPTHIEVGPPEHTKTPPRVKDADLAIVTLDKIPGKHCPRVALLVARFEIDRNGEVEFILRRNDGEADRLVTEETHQLPDGRWRAEYTRKYEFNHSVERKYMIEVVGQAKASAWMPMQIRCGDTAVGGLTGGAKPPQ